MRLIEHVRSQWMGALALFLVIAGGTAYAANTIGSSDIVNGQVKSPDIGTGQVQSVDVRDDTLSNGGLGSADIADGALNDEDIAKTRFVSFSGDIGEVGANECVDRPVSGINVAPGDHLVLTPEWDVPIEEADLSYSALNPVFNPISTNAMFIRVCNPTAAVINDRTTRFSLLIIDAQ